jgi:hypothetical protein
MRMEWTDISPRAMRWTSYSMTVFHEGTINPSLRCAPAMPA